MNLAQYLMQPVQPLFEPKAEPKPKIKRPRIMNNNGKRLLAIEKYEKALTILATKDWFTANDFAIAADYNCVHHSKVVLRNLVKQDILEVKKPNVQTLPYEYKVKEGIALSLKHVTFRKPKVKFEIIG